MRNLFRALILLMAVTSFSAKVEGGLLDGFLRKRSEKVLPPMIKVLVVSERPGVVVEVKGKYHLYDPKDNTHVSTRFLGKRKYMQALKGGLQWGEEFPGLYQLKIIPDDPTVTTIVDGVEYRGAVYIYDVEGSINVVNEVPVEDYLASMLSPKIRDQLPNEVLVALAITARTNAYYYVGNPKTPFWDIDGKKIGYQGYAVADGKAPIEKAIYASRYLTMSDSPANADVATPFLAQWGPIQPIGASPVVAKISLADAEKMSTKGDHAAQILARAFPGSSLVLMHYAEPTAPR